MSLRSRWTGPSHTARSPTRLPSYFVYRRSTAGRPRSRCTSRSGGSRCPGRRAGGDARMRRTRATAVASRSRSRVAGKPTRPRPRNRPSHAGAGGVGARIPLRREAEPGCSARQPRTASDRHGVIRRAGVHHHHLVSPRHRSQATADVRLLVPGQYDDADRDAPVAGSSPARYGRSAESGHRAAPAASRNRHQDRTARDRARRQWSARADGGRSDSGSPGVNPHRAGPRDFPVLRRVAGDDRLAVDPRLGERVAERLDARSESRWPGCAPTAGAGRR